MTVFHYYSFGPAKGELEISPCGLYATPHFSVPASERRKGWCSKLVDAMYVRAAIYGLTILWEDEPAYCGAGIDGPGVGWLSPDGQAFADSYRTRRSIPLPAFHYVNYVKQSREAKAA